MIGIIVIPSRSKSMHSLDLKRSLVLLPMGDRPLLQHIVEDMVAQGIVSIELVVSHAPEAVEALLGNGERWGCRFRYHLAAHPDQPYRSLKVIPEIRTQPWILVHAENYPCVRLVYDGLGQPRLFSSAASSVLGAPSSKAEEWIGTAIFPPAVLTDSFANQTIDELRVHLEDLASASQASVVRVQKWLDASTPTALLETQAMLLGKDLDGIMIRGVERDPGIWISRNVAAHPSVQFVAPVYIGPDTRISRGVRIGPNVVIEGKCIIDTNTFIENSMVTAGSYVGEGLELDDVLVDHHRLINARLGTGLSISESFLLGGLTARLPRPWWARMSQPVMALLLFVFFLPVFILAVLVYALRGEFLVSISTVQIPIKDEDLAKQAYPLLCIGSDAWSTQRHAGWAAFTRQFLPGLFAVAQGNLGFVGLPPRTTQEIQSLSEEWQQLYLAGMAGLITEVALAGGDPQDELQRYMADAYYSIRSSFVYNLKLAIRYFARLLILSS